MTGADCGAEDVAKRLYDKVVGIGVRRNLTFSRRFHDLIADAHGDPWRLLSPVCVCVCARARARVRACVRGGVSLMVFVLVGLH